MATTADPPPESPTRHIPPELVEKILLKLPTKSLLRFTAVSTSWTSTITSSYFAAAGGGARAVLIINDHPCHFNVRGAFRRPVSGVPGGPSPLVCPFRADTRLAAFCDDTFCVVAEKRLHLWSPSTGTHKRLPAVPRELRLLDEPAPSATETVYGLGYDAVSEDYKLLKISRVSGFISRRETSVLYSLKSDSWREIRSYLDRGFFPNCNGLFVNNALHWMVFAKHYHRGPNYMSSLISFNFLSEEFRVLGQPNYSPEVDLSKDVLDVANLRSKLCVFVNYRRDFKSTKFVVWAMEEYEGVDTWNKWYEIRYKKIPPVVSEFRAGTWFTLWPMYVYEDGTVLIWACSEDKKWSLIWYKDREVVGHDEIVAPPGEQGRPGRGSP